MKVTRADGSASYLNRAMLLLGLPLIVRPVLILLLALQLLQQYLHLLVVGALHGDIFSQKCRSYQRHLADI